MRRLAGIGAIILLLGSCARSPYDGYKLVGENVHLHLLTLGDGEELASDSDSVYVRLRMGQVEGEVGGLFSTERAYLAGDIRTGAMVPVLQRMHVGDSLSVIAPARQWPWEVFTGGMSVDHPDTGLVRLEVALLHMRTPAIMRAEAERLRRNDPFAYEMQLINAFVQASPVPFLRWGTSDIRYHLNGELTDTMAVAQRDIVTISYQGRSLEGGALFDDTERNGAPFTFTFGDKDQVIHGLEVAVSLLREGQEGTFLFPSLFAFGEKGIPGVLDPHTPVVYTVRLEKVERPERAGS